MLNQIRGFISSTPDVIISQHTIVMGIYVFPRKHITMRYIIKAIITNQNNTYFVHFMALLKDLCEIGEW